jgi:hypothetical protein
METLFSLIHMCPHRYRISTGESWVGIQRDCMNYWEKEFGARWVAALYFSSFVLLGQYILVNLFVAVICERFEDNVSIKNADGEDEVKLDDMVSDTYTYDVILVLQTVEEYL